MAFLGKTVSAEHMTSAQVPKHRVLCGGDISLDKKIAYLQGCVLAALLDDASIAEDERIIIKRIGYALRLPDQEIEECFSLKDDLSGSSERQREFLEELYSVLDTDEWKSAFVEDVERIFFRKGGCRREVKQYYINLFVKFWGEPKAHEAEERFETKRAEAIRETVTNLAKTIGIYRPFKGVCDYLSQTKLAHLFRKK